jgi:hypothetical protein
VIPDFWHVIVCGVAVVAVETSKFLIDNKVLFVVAEIFSDLLHSDAITDHHIDIPTPSTAQSLSRSP